MPSNTGPVAPQYKPTSLRRQCQIDSLAAKINLQRQQNRHASSARLIFAPASGLPRAITQPVINPIPVKRAVPLSILDVGTSFPPCCRNHVSPDCARCRGASGRGIHAYGDAYRLSGAMDTNPLDRRPFARRPPWPGRAPSVFVAGSVVPRVRPAPVRGTLRVAPPRTYLN